MAYDRALADRIRAVLANVPDATVPDATAPDATAPEGTEPATEPANAPDATVPDSDQTVTERAMFGGRAFLIRGHLTVAASNAGGLMVRTDPTDAPRLVETTPAEVVVMRGRPMPGWLRIDTIHLESDEALEEWIDRAVTYVGTLPAKS